MKVFLIVLLMLTCVSCSKEAEFYSIEVIDSPFANGLFLSKLTKHNIPYQFDYHMGEEYVLVHANFKQKIIKIRQNSIQEAGALALIRLNNQCSQSNLSKKLNQAAIFHQTVRKAGYPSIRVTQQDHNSEPVQALLAEDKWRCR